MSQTFKVGRYTMVLEREEDAISPQEDADTGLFLVANHRSFYVPPPGMKTVPQYRNEVEDLFKDTHWMFPLEAYIHSGVVLALSGEGKFPDRQWDVSQLGMVCVAKDEWRLSESARKAAVSLVETWNQYLSGDVWRWNIVDEKGEVLESCGSIYGLEHARKEALDAVKCYKKKA